MKKIILFLAAAAMFAACDKDNGENNVPAAPEDGTYVGTVTVTAPAFTLEDATVKITVGKDGKAAIEMQKVKFAEMMPSMDITIPGVTVSSTAAAPASFLLSGDGIIPLALGGEFEAYTITDLSGTFSASGASFAMKFGKFPTSFLGTVTAAEE